MVTGCAVSNNDTKKKTDEKVQIKEKRIEKKHQRNK